MSDFSKKYFCPRLLDYIIIVGARQPSWSHTVQTPELLRRYPLDDHQDFPLPPDVVFFCQPEGCVSVGPRRISLRETNSFVFTLTEKDSGRVRYGVCVNFYRPIDRRCRKEKTTCNGGGGGSSAAPTRPRNSSGPSGGNEPLSSSRVLNPGATDSDTGSKSPSPKTRRRQRVRSHSLTSLCVISHHPFFSTFRNCLFVLKRLIEACSDRGCPRRAGASKQSSR